MKFIRLKILMLFVFFGVFTIRLNAQGGYFIKNYSPSDYKLQSQNFDAAQTENGVMYFANNGGLLEYNGSEWHSIELENQHAFSVEVDDDKGIFVGSTSDFGKIDYNEKGQSYFTSVQRICK